MSNFAKIHFDDSMSMLSGIIHELIHDAPNSLRRIIISNPDQIILHIPSWIHYYMGMGTLSSESKLILFGINVTVGYENSLVLYHRDYTFTMNEDLIHKIPLMPGIEFKMGENISAIIFSMMPVDIKNKQNSQQN